MVQKAKMVPGSNAARATAPMLRGPSGRLAAKAVGQYVPKLTRTAFEKHGFSTVTLLTDWAKIVGRDLAAVTAPEKIRWPRPMGRSEDGEVSQGPRAGATLILAVHPGRALDIQYRTQQILERVNTYFGYRAVSELRIVQSADLACARPSANPTLRPARPATKIAEAQTALAAIPDEGLRAALARLEASLTARSNRR